MRQVIGLTLALLVSLSVFGGVPGQTGDGPGGVIYQKKTIIDIIDGIDIDVERRGPDGEIFWERSPGEFDSLIKLRTNFDRELYRSVHNL